MMLAHCYDSEHTYLKKKGEGQVHTQACTQCNPAIAEIKIKSSLHYIVSQIKKKKKNGQKMFTTLKFFIKHYVMFYTDL